MSGPVTQFINTHYRHFNAKTLRWASEAYVEHINNGGQMLVALAGAMSTAELGKSLAEMIRQGKVHAISCTGANLEEDVFNLVAHDHYRQIKDFRSLTKEDEHQLYLEGYNRVTDTCIPEDKAFKVIHKHFIKIVKDAEAKDERLFPHQLFYRLFESKTLDKSFQVDPKDSWLYAAWKKNLPIYVPGWEDSTMGNHIAASCLDGTFKSPRVIRSGLEYMMALSEWYQSATKQASIGFYQIGGGIAGDFPICVVPMLEKDLELQDVRKWGYFCQISDSTTSYGSYSGAFPNEKITWGKLTKETPSFIIESDATIVAPLMFAYILGW
ncbi:MAG: deoxyhypusine synthase family protein [Bdellovibrionales bacterium]|nr:deoxyhypusine synthase family protein [Bdellovibrionales bacterium]